MTLSVVMVNPRSSTLVAEWEREDEAIESVSMLMFGIHETPFVLIASSGYVTTSISTEPKLKTGGTLTSDNNKRTFTVLYCAFTVVPVRLLA
jgi:hypothetical protein